METISDTFKLALRDGPVRTTTVEVLTDPQASPIDVSDYFFDGSVNVQNQAVRRSGTIKFFDFDGTITPKTPDDLLAPFGNQLRIRNGIVYPDGSEELVAVGTLRIGQPQIRPPYVTLDLKDRSSIVSAAKLEQAYTIAKGTDYDQAILALLYTVFPEAEVNIPNVDFTTPLLVFDAQSDPWDALRQMATAIGHTIYFDPLGVCTMRPVQDLSSAEPVWTYDGKPSAGLPYDPDDWANLALYDQTLTWLSDDVINAVVATGESTSNAVPVFAVARDNDPSSPTQWSGKFGRHTLFWSSPLITTTGQAQTAARTRLQNRAGLAESLTTPALANPALDADDPIWVIRPEMGVDTLHVLDSFDVPLRANVQTLQSRNRRVVEE